MTIIKAPLNQLPEWFQEIADALEIIRPSPSTPIAGSFALWLWQALTTAPPVWKPSDVDIWYSSAKKDSFYQQLVVWFIALQAKFPNATMTSRGPAIVEIHLGRDLPKLQFIQRNVRDQERPAPHCFLDLFDLSVAQVAMTDFHLTMPDCSDATFASVTFEFGDDLVRPEIAARTCRCFRELEGTAMSMNRLLKYRERGFKIIQGDIHPLKEWKIDYYPVEAAETLDWKTFEPFRLMFETAVTSHHRNSGKSVRVYYLHPETKTRVPFQWESPSDEIPYGISVYPPPSTGLSTTVHKYSLLQSVTDPAYKDFLEALDARILEAFFEYQSKWFPAKNHKPEVVKFGYSPVLRSADSSPNTRGDCRKNRLRINAAPRSRAIIVHQIPVLWFQQSLWGPFLEVVATKVMA